MKNIELLQATGIKDICIVNYQLTDDRRVRELEAVLQKCGFRVRPAGSMNGLMRRFIRYRLSERITQTQKIKRRIKYLLFSAKRRLQREKKADGRICLYLLIDQLKTGDGWLHEEVQILLEKQHLNDRIFFYDVKSDRIMKFGKPVLGYLEFDVSGHCNLRCKGCSHYSNLTKEPVWGDLERFREHLVRLREVFDHIEVFRLVGGEPFLNFDGLLEVIRADYVRTARAKGLEENFIIRKHVMRNGLVPIVTMIGGAPSSSVFSSCPVSSGEAVTNSHPASNSSAAACRFITGIPLPAP